MQGAGFLTFWGVLAMTLGTVFAANVAGIADKLIASAEQTRSLAGRGHGIHPFGKIFIRAVGGLFAVIGVVAFGIGVTHL